jgi:hypothetical protein
MNENQMRCRGSVTAITSALRTFSAFRNSGPCDAASADADICRNRRLPRPRLWVGPYADPGEVTGKLSMCCCSADKTKLVRRAAKDELTGCVVQACPATAPSLPRGLRPLPSSAVDFHRPHLNGGTHGPIYHPGRWCLDGGQMENIRELRPRPGGDSEKITINLGYVDLGHIDLLETASTRT